MRFSSGAGKEAIYAQYWRARPVRSGGDFRHFFLPGGVRRAVLNGSSISVVPWPPGVPSWPPPVETDIHCVDDDIFTGRPVDAVRNQPAGHRLRGTPPAEPLSHLDQRSSATLGVVQERQNIASGSPFEPTIGFSRAVRVGDRVLVSGTGPVWPDGSCPDDPGTQARRCFEIIRGALVEAGADLSAVVRTRMYLTDPADADAVSAEHGRLFATVRPAATMVIVAGLVDARWKVEIEAEALVVNS